MRKNLFLFLISLLSFQFGAVVSLAQAICPTPENLSAAIEACLDATLNTACLGAGSITLTTHDDSASLNTIGDVLPLDNVRDFSVHDESFMLIKLGNEAYSTIIAASGVRVTNEVAPVDALAVITNSRARIRSTPSTASDANVLTALEAGVTIAAIGRTADSEWLYFDLGALDATFTGQSGWVAALLVDGDSERARLPVVAADTPLLSAFQSFSIVETDAAPCGVFITTPDNQTTTLLINGVSIMSGSTYLAQPEGGSVALTGLEGQITLGDIESPVFLAPGTTSYLRASVASEAVPASLESLQAGASFDVPELSAYMYHPDAEEASELIAEPVILAPIVQTAIIEEAPLSELQAEESFTQTFAPHGALSGRYSGGASQIVTHAFNPAAAGSMPSCQSAGIAAGLEPTLIFSEGAVNVLQWRNLSQIGDNLYGDSMGAHNLYTTIPSAEMFSEALTIRVISPTQVELSITSAGNFGQQVGGRACGYRFVLTWQGR